MLRVERPKPVYPIFLLNLLCTGTLETEVGLKSGICHLIAPVPVHCFSITFIIVLWKVIHSMHPMWV